MKGFQTGQGGFKIAAPPALKSTHSSSGSCYKSGSDSAGLVWVARLWLLVLGPQFGELRGNLLCGGGSPERDGEEAAPLRSACAPPLLVG